MKGSWGRKKGFRQSAETKAKISTGVRAAFLRHKEKEKALKLGQGKEGV